MNNKTENADTKIPEFQLDQFQNLINRLFQCCQERVRYQSERFGLPDAEFRCMMLFGEERYLTPKGIAGRMNVVKSRVSKILEGLEHKNLVQRIRDPEDSRIYLFNLTRLGQDKLNEINDFLKGIYSEVLSLIPPEQRRTSIATLETLTSSMNAVKELMT
jgi:DNA-binding MarR family transcriptional regulator